MFVASESSKPCSTARTIDGRFGPRIEQPHLRLHGERVRALLHDAGALTVVFADDDHRAARNAARREVGERVGGDVGADRGFECHRAAKRIVHGRGQRRGSRGFRGALLEVNTELFQNVARVRQNIHQMRDRRALIAGDIRHSRLQESLGDGQNSLTAELLPIP